MSHSAPAALITGSGRCGTGYTAAVLRSTGLRVGHERWWTLDRTQDDDLDVDVSWLGCFDEGYTGPVYGQVRHPGDCIPSIAAAYAKHPWRIVYAQNVHLIGDPIIDAARIWTTYTRHAIDRCRSWWMVETLSADDLAPFGVDATEAIKATGRDINARPRTSFEWPDHPDIHRALTLAREIGYAEV